MIELSDITISLSQAELNKYSYDKIRTASFISSEHFSGERRGNYFLIDRRGVEGTSFRGAKIHISIAEIDGASEQIDPSAHIANAWDRISPILLQSSLASFKAWVGDTSTPGRQSGKEIVLYATCSNMSSQGEWAALLDNIGAVLAASPTIPHGSHPHLRVGEIQQNTRETPFHSTTHPYSHYFFYSTDNPSVNESYNRSIQSGSPKTFQELLDSTQITPPNDEESLSPEIESCCNRCNIL